LTLELDDGTPVFLRPLSAEDRERLREGFETLSTETRQHRFLAPVTQLSTEQLRYFTEVDQQDHVAWGAAALREDGTGLGVGRWVRLRATPETAEFSLTVVDEAQGRGLGRLLLAVLVVRAEELGVRTLRGLVSRDNETMVEWLTRLGAAPAPDDDADDGTVVMDLPVPPPQPSTPAGAKLAAAIAAVRAVAG